MNGKRTGMGVGVLAASCVVVLVVAIVLGLRQDRDSASPATVVPPEVSSQPVVIEGEPAPQDRTEVVVPPQVLARQAEAAATAPLVAAKGFVVVDSLSDEALEGVDWQLDHASEPQQGLTAADGRIVLGSTGIEAMLLVHRGGYLWRWVEPSEHESLPLREDGLRTLALTPTGQLDVRVVDVQGQPVLTAFIKVDPGRDPRVRRGWPMFRSLVPSFELKGHDWEIGATYVNGSVSFDALPVGEPLLVQLGSPVVEKKQIVTLDVTTRKASLEFVREWCGSLVGRFVSLDGQPLDGIAYTCLGPDGYRADLGTNSKGRIQIFGLPAGSYSLHVAGRTDPIQVEVADKLVDLGDVVLSASSRIEGKILFPDDGAKIRDEIQVLSLLLTAVASTAEPVRLKLYEDAHFEGFANAGPFSYLLRYGRGEVLLAGEAVAPDTGLVLDVRGLTCSLRLSLPAVSVAPTEMLLLPPTSEWESNARPRPVQSASVVLESGSAVRLRAVPEGVWSLRITGYGRGAAWIPDLRFTRGTTLDLGPVELGFAAVAGTVSNLAGEPLADVEVIAYSRLDRALSPSRTDGQGRYLLRALEPGPYELRLGGALGGTGRQVDLRAGETLEGIDLTMDQRGGIRGRLHEHGTPIVGARLRLDVDFFAAQNKVTSTLSGADGSFEFDRLAPGERMLAIDRDTPEGKVDFLGLVAVEVRQGEVTEVDLDVATDVELELWIGDERITDATSFTLFGPGRNERRFTPDPQGRFHIPVSSEPRIVKVHAPRFRLASARNKLAEPCALAQLVGSSAPRQQVSISTAPVRVPCASEQPPNVRLFSVDGIPTLSLSVSAISCAPVRWTKTEFELEHVPVGAEIEVERIDASRGRVVERLRVHVDGVARP